MVVLLPSWRKNKRWALTCHTTILIIWHAKKVNLVKWGVELKMNWLNWSIPISSGFQFQFNSNSKSFNSIPIQFMLNWIELIINSNSIHELIRALHDGRNLGRDFVYYITGINPEAILMVGDHYDHPLCPGLQPGPLSQTPGGLGQRYWSVSVVTWPPKPGVSEVGVFRALQPNDNARPRTC